MERKQLIAELEANGFDVHEEHPMGDPQVHLIVKKDGTVVDELIFDADDQDLMKKKADGPAGWHRGKGYSGETMNVDVDFSAPNSDDFQEHNPGLDRPDQELPDTKPIEFKPTEDEYTKGRQPGIIPNDESDRGSRGGYSLGSKVGDYPMTNKEAQVPGGLANEMSDDLFDPDELAKGIDVEYEHTSDRELAKDIAKDHLFEIPDYYSRLEKMENDAKADDKYNQEGVQIREKTAGELPAGWTVEFSPEHFNSVAQATIPEAWEVRNEKGWVVGWGDTREEAIKNSQTQSAEETKEEAAKLPDGSGFMVGTVGAIDFQIGQVWKDPGSGDLMTIEEIDQANDKMTWGIQTPDGRSYKVNPTFSGMKEELQAGNIVKVAEDAGGESSSSVPFNPETYKELKDRGLTKEEPGQSLRQTYEPIEASLEKIGMEIGDKVKCRIDGSIGEVIGVPQNKSEVEQGYFVSVRWESGEEDLMGVDMLEKIAYEMPSRFAVGEPDEEDEKEADGYSYEETTAPKVSASDGHFYVDVDNELGLWVIKSTDNPSLVIESHPTLEEAKKRMIELNGGVMMASKTADSEICSVCGGDGYDENGNVCPACEGTGRLPKLEAGY